MEELQQLPKYVNMRGPEHARLSFEQVLQLAKDLSDALFYLHEQVCAVIPLRHCHTLPTHSLITCMRLIHTPIT